MFAQAPDADLEGRLAAAIHSEVVTGDLTGAVNRYTAILAQAPNDDRFAARGLMAHGAVSGGLGRRDAARGSYVRLVHEFGDQGEIASRAREKLASWSRTPQGPLNLDFERGEAGRHHLDGRATAKAWRNCAIEGCRAGSAVRLCQAPAGCYRPSMRRPIGARL